MTFFTTSSANFPAIFLNLAPLASANRITKSTTSVRHDKIKELQTGITPSGIKPYRDLTFAQCYPGNKGIERTEDYSVWTSQKRWVGIVRPLLGDWSGRRKVNGEKLSFSLSDFLLLSTVRHSELDILNFMSPLYSYARAFGWTITTRARGPTEGVLCYQDSSAAGKRLQ